jgi:4-amino-4-deoxy-L-arabinose transferase-like glycosyltransferase
VSPSAPASRHKLVAVTRVHPWFLGGGVLALAAILFFGRLGERALWSMELRWAEIPREMQLSGSYCHPTINGGLYYDKPLGSYWLVLAAGWLTGTVDELAARLPSATAGLIGVALLMDLARRLYDGRTAVLAGLILTTSFGYVFFARCASADAETVAGELAALVLFIRHERRATGPWVVGLWVVMAVTSLTKGLLGFALPLLVLVCYSSLTPSAEAASWPRMLVRRNQWLFCRATLIGAVLAGTVYLAPFAASGDVADRGLALVYRENLQRFFAPHNHRGPIYLYAYVVFGLMAPWSAFLPAALLQMRSRLRSGDRRGADRFTLIYFAATFAFFTLSASRRSYYLLPVLPAGALLVARLLTAGSEALSPGVRVAQRIGFVVLTAIVVGAGIALLPPEWVLPGAWAGLPAAPATTAFALGWLACLAGLAWAWQSGRMAVAAGLVAALAMTYLFLLLLPSVEPYRGEREFAAQVRRVVGPDRAGLALYRTRELVYYLNAPGPIAEFDTPADLRAAAVGGWLHWAVLRRRDLGCLPTPVQVLVEETTYPWDGEAECNAKALLVDLRAAR